MKKFSFPVLFLFIIEFLCLSCGKYTSKTKYFLNSDKSFLLEAPSRWREDATLNSSADLQISDRSNQFYLIVMTEPVSDLHNMDLNLYSDLTFQEIKKTIQDAKAIGPIPIPISGTIAIEWQLIGSLDYLNVIYWHYSFKINDHFYQILTWTVPSRASQYENILAKIISSFHEYKEISTTLE